MRHVIRMVMPGMCACILFSCSSNLLDKKIDEVSSDFKVDKQEFTALYYLADSTKECIGNGAVDTNLLVARIQQVNKRIEKKNIHVVNPKAKPAPKFEIGVYIENSGSMFGYVSNPGGGFRTSLYGLLGDLRSRPFCNGLHVGYVNDNIYPVKSSMSNADIDAFVNDMSPTNFQGVGKTAASNLHQVIKMVLDRASQDRMAIIVSDFIDTTDPGMSGVGIRNIFRDKMTGMPLSVVVLRAESPFQGKFYPGIGGGVPYNGNRPFYMWLVGTPEQLSAVSQAGVLDHLVGGYTHKHQFLSQDPAKLKYRLGTALAGQFRSDPACNTCITRPQAGPDGAFKFSVMADFSHLPFSDDYLADLSNYVVSATAGDYQLVKVEPTTAAKATHKLVLQAQAPIPVGEVTVALQSRMPAWVSQFSTDKSVAGTAQASTHTYGLSSLMKGMSDAFSMANPEAGEQVARIRLTIIP